MTLATILNQTAGKAERIQITIEGDRRDVVVHYQGLQTTGISINKSDAASISSALAGAIEAANNKHAKLKARKRRHDSTD